MEVGGASVFSHLECQSSQTRVYYWLFMLGLSRAVASSFIGFPRSVRKEASGLQQLKTGSHFGDFIFFSVFMVLILAIRTKFTKFYTT